MLFFYFNCRCSNFQSFALKNWKLHCKAKGFLTLLSNQENTFDKDQKNGYDRELQQITSISGLIVQGCLLTTCLEAPSSESIMLKPWHLARTAALVSLMTHTKSIMGVCLATKPRENALPKNNFDAKPERSWEWKFGGYSKGKRCRKNVFTILHILIGCSCDTVVKNCCAFAVKKNNAFI